MSSPRQFVDPVVEPPDIEYLAEQFLTPLLAPTPVATRLPDVSGTADTENGFMRVESAGGTKVGYWQWDYSWLLHGYSTEEEQAQQIAATTIKYASAARGQSIANWFVVGVMHIVLPARLTDPNVNLPRYRGMATWRLSQSP